MPESRESSRVSITSGVLSILNTFRILIEIEYISEVESDLPEDIRDDALRVFRSAIADKSTIQDAINEVTVFQRLCECVDQIMRKWAEFENLIKVSFVGR